MSKELITVVTVCFNAGQTIAKTMQSVLNQTYRPLEYILVDCIFRRIPVQHFR